jgi:signal transduction histidine kinase
MTARWHRRRETPWWPANQPWPSPHYYRRDRHGRARFFRRAALGALALFALALWGLFTVASLIANQFGLGGWAAAVPALVVLLGAGMALTAMARGMRRFASPLAAVMEAADRVAGGDYTVRVAEQGPPPIRALTHSFNTMTGRLQDADRLRRDLMADVAHELRTPLSILQGRLEGLIDGVYPPDETHLWQLLEETHVLSRLVEDLRTLALSEAGALQLQKESTDIVELVRDTVTGMQTEAARAGVTLTVSPEMEASAIDLDPVRIREVLTNLLSNALRHAGPSGIVNVALRMTDQGVAVTVADTGSGMPPGEAARVFDRFYRGAGSRGSGLGLTIAKGIVTAHNGQITVLSQIGHGTTFTFVLPRDPA